MLTYKKSGVDIDKANALVEYIKKRSSGIGGFSGLFPLGVNGGRHCLVASTDGVGTKLKVAFSLDRHHTIGIDLVAMSVNDLITCGAKPLLFLDYYATSRLDLKRSKHVVDGILAGCRQADTVLLGGETAEMPGFYTEGEYDLAGFAVGLVDRREVIDGSRIRPGDRVLGLPSSGLHSNGFSLVRKVFRGGSLRRWGKTLLTPTRIYVRDIRKLLAGLRRRGHRVLGMAHITGGGFPDNIPRVLPKGTRAVIDTGAWKVPAVFREIQRRGRVPEREMWRTFNMGIGMVLIVRPEAAAAAGRLLPKAKVIGRIVKGKRDVVLS